MALADRLEKVEDLLALLTNGATATPVYREVSSEVLGALAGVSVPPLTFQFLEPDAKGRPRYYHAGGRANRRVP